MRKSKPFLELRGVTLRAGDRLVFRNTNWIFGRGQHWALVGCNASGKTLLASALAGEIPLAGGEIVYGFSRRGCAPEDAVAHVSFEQQKAIAGNAPAAARWFEVEEAEAVTVREFLSQDNVEEVNPFEVVRRSPYSAVAFRRSRRRVVRLLRIESLQNRLLPSLSNGEMRKTLLARALLRRPRLLILDDPFSGLDAEFRRHLKHVLQRLVRGGVVRLLLVVNRRDDLPRGITHLLYLDRCRAIAQGRLGPMLADSRVSDVLAVKRMHLRVRGRSAAVSRNEEEIVRLDRVSVRYGGRTILDDVSWSVRRGERWALVGPNGSGKSTLLSLIIGDNPQAYANAVCVFGRPRGGGETVWALKKRIGLVSPELHLHFPETETCIAAVISGFRDHYSCNWRPTTQERRAALRWLARFGLLRYAGRPLGSLSAGLQRLVLFARTMVKSPELLVLDEPCHGLDRAQRTQLLRVLEALLRRTATAMIYVTHRLDEIPDGTDCILRLRNGRAVARSVRYRRLPG